MDIQALLGFLVKRCQGWAQTQRTNHRPTARPLSDLAKADFARFFDSQTLESARIRRVPVIENPEFYPELKAMGIAIPLDFTMMSGITFEDTILISDRQKRPELPLAPLLFHELVHVVQYEALGLAGFMEQYVQGWAQNGFQYAAIPLERDAYNLQGRYKTQPHEAFSVRAEVRRRLGLSLEDHSQS